MFDHPPIDFFDNSLDFVPAVVCGDGVGGSSAAVGVVVLALTAPAEDLCIFHFLEEVYFPKLAYG